MRRRVMELAVWSTCVAPAFLAAQGGANPSPLTIHGYLSQAYAKSNGEQILGITKSGTTDYRTAAIQFSYATSDNDRIVLQFDHRRLGVSPTAREDQVELDWAFFGHRFSNGTTLKVGKVLIPLGIYNEIRDVGTLLPFYRAPTSFYIEGAWTEEAVDGASLSRTFNVGARWSVDAMLYAGEWNYKEFNPTPTSYDVLEAHARRGAGSQFWVNTPIDGLRFGGGNEHYEAVGSVQAAPGSVVTNNSTHAGIDGSFSHFKVQSEIRDRHWRDGKFRSGYLLLGAKPSKVIDLNVEADVSRLSLDVPGLGSFHGMKLSDDYATGINYHFTESVIAKLEYHWTRGLLFERPTDFFGPPARARYMILSFSTAF